MRSSSRRVDALLISSLLLKSVMAPVTYRLQVHEKERTVFLHFPPDFRASASENWKATFAKALAGAMEKHEFTPNVGQKATAAYFRSRMDAKIKQGAVHHLRIGFEFLPVDSIPERIRMFATVRDILQTNVFPGDRVELEHLLVE